MGYALIQPAVGLLEYELATVGGDVEISGIEFRKFVNAAKQCLNAFPFKRG